MLLAALIALLLTRSVTRRVKTVSKRANQVATEQLPALVEAIRDPRGKAVLPEVKPISTRGNDELAELARSFNTMQATLVDVAHEQVEVLRRGVSEIFITMARRNRSLIDRQLAMLDEFEAEVDDPEVLSNYYQLDHMATRMRRSSESLLVLANADPKRRRVKATEIDDVVRAAIGEVEDYRRIEVEALEHLQVRGNVVADVSHLLAELLDNATSFSPPDSTVRLGGRRAGDSYIIRIVDLGVGITGERLTDLNELLREPPIVGLSVEPTLGMSVVSLLAARHGVTVTLSHSSPGTTVDVLLPSSMFGPIDEPAFAPTTAPLRLADEPTTSEPFEPYEPDMAWAEAAMADEDIEPTLPTTPVMPLVVAEAVIDHVEPIVPSRGGPAIAGEPLIERQVEADVAPSWAGRSFDFSDAAGAVVTRCAGAGGDRAAGVVRRRAGRRHQRNQPRRVTRPLHVWFLRCRPAAISRLPPRRRRSPRRRSLRRPPSSTACPLPRSRPPASHSGRSRRATRCRPRRFVYPPRLSLACRHAHPVAAPTDPIAWLARRRVP